MKKNVPEIRFKEFTDEWTSTNLGRCFEERVERSGDGELISVTINYGVVRASDLDRVDNSSSDKSNYKKVEVGDIAYNSMRMWQGACGYSEYSGICSPAYTVVSPNDGIDVIFFSYMFKRDDMLYKFRSNSQGLTSDTWNLKYPAFSKIGCIVPKEIEQQKISMLLKTLDKLISKLEQKVEQLKNIKQSLLNQMFTGGGRLIPEIRFKEFKHEEWVMRKLSDISERVTRKNANNVSSLTLTVSSQYGLIAQNEFFKSNVAGRRLEDYYLVRRGEFAYNKSSSDGFPFGAVKRLDKYEMGVLSTLYIVFFIKESMMNSDFAASFYDSSYWYDDVSKKAAVGARNHGLLNISANDFFETRLYIPADLREQRLIGYLFMQLDKELFSESEKLAKVRNMKQSMLHKMFVNN